MPKINKVRLKEKRKRKRYLLLAFAFVLFIGALVGAGIGLNRSEVTITSITVTGAVFTRENLVHQMIDGLLEGSYFFVIPKTNTFLYPKYDIKKNIFSFFPAVKDVSFQRDGLTGLSVVLIEREPRALWCASFATTSPCYFIDETGFIFSKTEHEPSLMVYSGLVDGEPLTETYLSGDFPAFNALMKEIARATGRTPENVFIDEHFDVSVVFEEGGELRFARKGAGELLLGNIASVFASRRFREDGEKLEYADFRFGNKIYVKFEGE